MKYGIYAIKDQVTGLFGEPWLAVNTGAAVRRFNFCCENAKLIANDSMLYRLGEFDGETGEIVSKVEFMQSYVSEE